MWFSLTVIPDFTIESWSKSEFPLVTCHFILMETDCFVNIKNSLLSLSALNMPAITQMNAQITTRATGELVTIHSHVWYTEPKDLYLLYYPLSCTLGGPGKRAFEWMMWKHCVPFSSICWPLVFLDAFWVFLDLIFSHIHSIPYIFTQYCLNAVLRI